VVVAEIETLMWYHQRMENIPDVEYLKTVLGYDPETGVFTWLVNRGGTARVGTVAGNIQKMGYRYINFRGKLVGAHRLAWLYVHGVWPNGDIDHINRMRDDNWIANLREATRSQNMRNSIRVRTASSPLQGVCWDKQAQKWLASITSNGKQIHLGRYETAELAHEAYVKACREVHGEHSPF
jgi:hypothetical protein